MPEEVIFKEVLPPGHITVFPSSNEDTYGMLLRLFGPSDPTDFIQYRENNFASTVLESGEKKFWFVFLKMSFLDYQQCLNKDTDKKHVFKEIFNWFFNPEKNEIDWPGSFENVCSVFNLNANYVRKLLIQWTKDNYGKTSPKKRQHVNSEFADKRDTTILK